MEKIKKIYELYKKYLPDILLLITVFFLIFFASNIPYINLIIVNIDPLLTSIVAVWILFYLLKTPDTKKIMISALVIFLINYILVLLHREKIAELLSSLSFSMIFTAAIVELVNLKNKLKKESSDK